MSEEIQMPAITETRQLEYTMDFGHDQLISMLSTLDGPIYVSDPDTYEVLHANEVLTEKNGDIIGQKCYKAIHGHEYPCSFCTNQHIFGENLGQTYVWEHWNRTDHRWYHCVDRAIAWHDGRMVRCEMASEIINRKLTEDELAVERDFLAAIPQLVSDGIICVGVEGRILMMNKAAEQITGWAEKAAVGKFLSEVFSIVDEKTRKPCENLVETIIKTGGTFGLANRVVLVNSEGEKLISIDSGTLIHDRRGNITGALLVIRDITEDEKMERELLKVQKLESIGLIAGGIAHDFNNILTAIMGNISLAKMRINPNDRIFERLEEIERASRKARKLTQQLLNFSRNGTPVLRPVCIAQLLRDSANFVLRDSNADCEISVQDDLWPVDIDEGQMSQVINNVLLNADQSMPKGGGIRVVAENVVTKPEGPLPLKAGRYVRVSIRDQGHGISRESLPSIFEPYFTTKEKGNGLGLAISNFIIKSHGGHIAVESQTSVGTNFSIYLPVSSANMPAKER